MFSAFKFSSGKQSKDRKNQSSGTEKDTERTETDGIIESETEMTEEIKREALADMMGTK